MVFCEARCRHGQECDVLISAERQHPVANALFTHHATDHAKHEAHEWRSKPETLVGKGACQVRSLWDQPSESKPLTITVKIPGT
jgi:hypothetical protein